jgi:hypothetical protein
MCGRAMSCYCASTRPTLQAKLNQAEANLATQPGPDSQGDAPTSNATSRLRARRALSRRRKVGEMRTAAAATRSRQQSADAAAAELARLQHCPTPSSGRPSPASSARSWCSPAPRSRSMKRPWPWSTACNPLHVGFAVPEKYLPSTAGRHALGRQVHEGRHQPCREAATLPGKPTCAFIDNGVDVPRPVPYSSRPSCRMPRTKGSRPASSSVSAWCSTRSRMPWSSPPRRCSTAPMAAVSCSSAKEDGTVGHPQGPRRLGAAARSRSSPRASTAGEAVVTEGHLRLTDGCAFQADAPEGKPGKPAQIRRQAKPD